jgi:hypothetical protein
MFSPSCRHTIVITRIIGMSMILLISANIARIACNRSSLSSSSAVSSRLATSVIKISVGGLPVQVGAIAQQGYGLAAAKRLFDEDLPAVLKLRVFGAARAVAEAAGCAFPGRGRKPERRCCGPRWLAAWGHRRAI